jgi:hypothetical protein
VIKDSPHQSGSRMSQRVRVTDDLKISIGKEAVKLTPSKGLELAETLARKSFRRAMTLEAESLTGVDPQRGPLS